MKKFVLSFFVLATLSASAQKISNKYGLKAGQTVQVTSEISTTSEIAMLGESKNSSSSIDLYKIKSVNGGNTVIEQSVKNLKLNISMMGNEIALDSDKPEDLQGKQGELLKSALESKKEYTIDANGVVSSVVTTADNKNQAGDMMSMLTQSNAAGVLKAGSGSTLKVLPAYAVGVGDSWTDSTSEGGNTNSSTYTLKSINGGEALVDFVSNSTISTTQEMMGMSADMKGKTKTTGTITVDAATGLPKRRTSTATADMTVNVAGQEMNVMNKMTATSTYTIQ